LRIQAAEVRQPGCRAGAAEKTRTLDEDRRAPRPARRCGRGDARRSAAEHDDLVLAEDFRLALWLENEHLAGPRLTAWHRGARALDAREPRGATELLVDESPDPVGPLDHTVDEVLSLCVVGGGIRMHVAR